MQLGTHKPPCAIIRADSMTLNSTTLSLTLNHPVITQGSKPGATPGSSTRTLTLDPPPVVAQGSKPGEGDPRFIHLTYTPEGPVTKHVVLIGKGLTFDSGGYNLKAGAGSMIEVRSPAQIPNQNPL